MTAERPACVGPLSSNEAGRSFAALDSTFAGPGTASSELDSTFAAVETPRADLEATQIRLDAT
jgi:hypothetical protein